MSWDEAFANRYDQWSADMTADIPFYVELAREADGPLVELAIGGGRVAIPVAQATGQRVLGIDTSPAMLEPIAVAVSKSGRFWQSLHACLGRHREWKWAAAVRGPRSEPALDCHNRDEGGQPHEVLWVARVQRQLVGMGHGRDEQVGNA